ncbi:MAG: ankyrin repeat domain-containing protein [Verrucomicrobiota bacterium]
MVSLQIPFISAQVMTLSDNRSPDLEDIHERLRSSLKADKYDDALVRKLVADGANPSQQAANGNSLLNSAIWDVLDTGDLSKVKLLLELGADANNAFHDDERPILECMYVANIELFTLLINAGADVSFLVDERESLLDWVAFDRSYHAHHSNDDDRDREIVQFYDAVLPVLRSKGAKTTKEFIVRSPKKYVSVSRFGLWTATGDLQIDAICPDKSIIAKFEDWKIRGMDVWPEGAMPSEFDRHGYNLEGLSVAIALRRHLAPGIEVRYCCLDPIPCWWFQGNGTETIIPPDSETPMPLAYETGGTCHRGDVVYTAIFEVAKYMIKRQARVLVDFQPLPFACHYKDLENAVRSTGIHHIAAWDAELWPDESIPVHITNDGEIIQIGSEHPTHGFCVSVSHSSMAESIELPNGRMHHLIKSHEYAVWNARARGGYHSETIFYWL